MGQVNCRKHYLSLRKSLVLYVIAFVVLAVFLSVTTFSICDGAAEGIGRHQARHGAGGHDQRQKQDRSGQRTADELLIEQAGDEKAEHEHDRDAQQHRAQRFDQCAHEIRILLEEIPEVLRADEAQRVAGHGRDDLADAETKRQQDRVEDKEQRAHRKGQQKQIAEHIEPQVKRRFLKNAVRRLNQLKQRRRGGQILGLVSPDAVRNQNVRADRQARGQRDDQGDDLGARPDRRKRTGSTGA